MAGDVSQGPIRKTEGGSDIETSRFRSYCSVWLSQQEELWMKCKNEKGSQPITAAVSLPSRRISRRLSKHHSPRWTLDHFIMWHMSSRRYRLTVLVPLPRVWLWRTKRTALIRKQVGLIVLSIHPVKHNPCHTVWLNQLLHNPEPVGQKDSSGDVLLLSSSISFCCLNWVLSKSQNESLINWLKWTEFALRLHGLNVRVCNCMILVQGGKMWKRKRSRRHEKLRATNLQKANSLS